MSQSYYFKMPIFLTQGTTPRYVVVEFDGAEVANATITATDVASAQNIEFTAEKTPGLYTLKVSVPDPVPEGEWACVVVDDIWISVDNTNWKSMIVNGVPSNDFADVSYGFNPAKGAHLYGEEETCSWNIPLVDSQNWNTKYLNFDEIFVNSTDEELAVKFSNDLENIAKYKKAIELLSSRGYS